MFVDSRGRSCRHNLLFYKSYTHLLELSWEEMWIWNRWRVPASGYWICHRPSAAEGNEGTSVGHWRRCDTAGRHLVSAFNTTRCGAEALIQLRCLLRLCARARSRSLAPAPSAQSGVFGPWRRSECQGFCNPAFIRLLRRPADLYLRHRSIYANATAFAVLNAGARIHLCTSGFSVGGGGASAT